MRLLAYKNETVEQFGVTAMYFKGAFLKKYSAIGMTLCNETIFDKISQLDSLESFDPIDRLAFFYQAVR